MKGTIKKGIAWILTTAMVAAMVPVMAEPKQAQAEESQAQENPTTTKTITGLGTSVIVDPTDPGDDTTKAWTGSYVYYGNYDADGDGKAEPVKYRVLDASTTDYSADGTTQTMLLDCDSILYNQKFDNDGSVNERYRKANEWSISDVKKNLNGDGFLNKEGVFTSAEKNAIAASTVAGHPLTTDSETGVNVEDWTRRAFENYVALTGEQIFLLDVEDVSNGAYGYSMTHNSCENRKKTGNWWLRSAYSYDAYTAGCLKSSGVIYGNTVYGDAPWVSPAMNVNLSSVLFSSVISGTAGETGAEYKLTLLDGDMTIEPGSGVTNGGNRVTVPYSISGMNSANATQVSVMVLDKEYTAGNTNGASVLDYQKLNVDNFSTSGMGTFTLPSDLTGTLGTDYYIYLLAEDVNNDNSTDYASEPVKIKIIGNLYSDISKATVMQRNTLTYDGAEKVPEFTVILGGFILSEEDYEIKTALQKDAGTYTATIKGKGDYTGEITDVSWSIGKAEPAITWNDQTIASTGEESVIMAPTLTFIGNDEPEVELAYSYKVQGDAEYTNGLPSDCGTYDVKVNVSATDNYSAVEDAMTLTITCTDADNNFICDYCGSYDEPKLVDEYYQIANSGNLMWFAHQVNEGQTAINAKLTADIDMKDVDWTIMSSFAGTFDGNGHTILYLCADESGGDDDIANGSRCGLFQTLSEGGAVTNLTISGAQLWSAHSAGAIAAVNNGTISKCIVKDSTIELGASHGLSAIAGKNTGIVTDCGVVNCFLQRRWGAANSSDYAIGAVVEDNSGTVSNCFSYGCTFNNSPNLFAIVESGNAPVNCHYYTGTAVLDTVATAKTAEVFASGEVAYLLNSTVTDGSQSWYQTLSGETADIYPVLKATHGTVRYGYTSCASEAQKVYSNGEVEVNKPEHIPEKDDGKCDITIKCSKCGDIIKAAKAHTDSDTDGSCDECGWLISVKQVNESYHPELNDTHSGYYAVESAKELYWIAEYINEGSKDINVVLTADIDFSGWNFSNNPWTPICQTASFHEGNVTDTGYTGIFDGNGHFIKGLNVKGISGNTYSYGLFGTVSGTIKNLGMMNFTYTMGKASDTRAGSVAGQILTGGTITNCYSVEHSITTNNNIAGGIAGCNYGGTISNCHAYNGRVTGYQTRWGGIVGDCKKDSGDDAGSVKNCYTDDERVVSTQSTEENITDCYVKKDEAFASGEVAYSLNGSSSKDVTWYQTLGEDGQKYPILTGTDIVYCGYDMCVKIYSNSSEGLTVEQQPHAWSDGMCSYCKLVCVHAWNYDETGITCSNCGRYEMVDIAIKPADGSVFEKNEYDYDNNTKTHIINTTKKVAISGESTTETVIVAKDVSANIIFNGVNIDASKISKAPFMIADGSSGSVTITIADDSNNTLIGGNSCAGLMKNGTTGTLTIRGEDNNTGSLTATGGKRGAGIGGGDLAYGYNITISGGIVTARGGDFGAGIGGGLGYEGVNIRISGGTVRVFSGSTANAIGGGYSSNAVTPTSDGTTPVYLLALDNEEGKDIVINGKDYPDAHGNEKRIYVYLPAATEAEPNIVKADEEIIHKFFYDNGWKERCITGVASKLLGTGDSVANISMNPSNGYAENGEKITVNAQNMLGYTFKGWYLPEDIDESYQIKEGRVAQSTSYIYTFYPSKYIMLYAIYEAAGEAEVICGGGDFKVAVNGEEASDIQNSYTEQLAIGSEVTITVTDDNFINWLNGNNKIVTTEKEYTFTVTGDITLTMGKQGEKGQTAMVEFVSAYNQLIAGQIYDSDDTIAFPSYPSKVGYIFTGWSLTEEEIHTKISEGETHITVVPVYEQNISKTHDVDVYVDGNWDSDLSVEEVLTGTTMTLKAPAIEGKVFLYWRDGFNIAGYNDSYFLQVNTYRHIYAVYGDEVVEEKPVIAMTDVFTTSNNDKDKLSFSVTRSIPDGYTLIEHGMLYHTKQEITTPTEGSFILGGTGVNKYVSTDSHKLGVFTLNVNVTGANTAMVIARGYMIVRNNATGNEEIYYSGISHTNYDDKNRWQ